MAVKESTLDGVVEHMAEISKKSPPTFIASHPHTTLTLPARTMEMVNFNIEQHLTSGIFFLQSISKHIMRFK
jgi:hypothetical protein